MSTPNTLSSRSDDAADGVASALDDNTTNAYARETNAVAYGIATTDGPRGQQGQQQATLPPLPSLSSLSSSQQQPQYHNSAQQQPFNLPQRYSNKAATAIARLAPSFLYSSRPPSAHGKREIDHQSAENRPTSFGTFGFNGQTNAGQTSSRYGIHETEKPVAALDISPDRSHVALAGRDLLRIAHIDAEGNLLNDVNIFNRINAKHREQLAVVDVKWSREHGSLLATAAGSGRIVLYDLTRPYYEFTTLYEHVRQVHKLAFSPHGGSFFLSAGHDGGIKQWDLRDVRDNRRSKATFQGSNHGIRDVKWSITDAFEFAVGTDSGVVQRWDMRKSRAPIIQINAHDQTCHSIDYHPHSRHLVTAGTDRKIKVWDTTRTERRQNACWQIQAPQSVLNVAWRPNTAPPQVDEGMERSTRRDAQIATSYDSKDLRVHVWDFGRPSIPCLEINRFNEPTSSMLWRSSNLIWTVGGGSNKGIFAQFDVEHANRPIETLNTNVLAVAPDDTMSFFSDARTSNTLPLPGFSGNILERTTTNSSNGDRLSNSFSANEASFEEGGPLSSKLKHRRLTAAASRMHAGMPRTGDVLFLNEQQDMSSSVARINMEGTFITSQIGAHARLRDTLDVGRFKFLANNYASPADILRAESSLDIGPTLERILLQNSNEAAAMGDDGLAHTWRVLAWSVRKELDSVSSLSAVDAKHAQARGMSDRAAEAVRSFKPSGQQEDGPAAQISGGLFDGKAMTGRQHESTSNVPTPRFTAQAGTAMIPKLPAGSLGEEIVKPLSKSEVPLPFSVSNTTISADSHVFSQGFETHQAFGDTHQDGSDKHQFHAEKSEPQSDLSSLGGLEEELAARRMAMSNYRVTPRPVLRFDDNNGNPHAATGTYSSIDDLTYHRPEVPRYGSGESFDMLSESVDSYGRSFGPDSFEESPSARPTLTDRAYALDDGPVASHGMLIPGRHGSARAAKGTLPNAPSSLRSDTQTRSNVSVDDIATNVQKDAIHLQSSREQNKIALPMVHANEIDVSSPAVRVEGIVSAFQTSDGSWAQRLFDKHVSRTTNEDHKPWYASSFLPALLYHHLNRLSSLQMPVFLMLYLHRSYPTLFPTTISVNHDHAQSPFTYSRLMAVVLSYHARLVALRQFVAAASLRNDCASVIPEITTRAQPGKVSVCWCRSCAKPSRGLDKGYCGRCNRRWGGCAVCGRLKIHSHRHGGGEPKRQEGSSSRFDQSGRCNARLDAASHRQVGKRWMYCQTCGHGGHPHCLSDWLSRPESGGACPVVGCHHACGPGSRREQTRTELARHRAEVSQLRRGNGVLRDDNVVHESRAVKAARPGALEMDVGNVLFDSNDGDTKLTTGGIPMESVGIRGPVGLGVGMGIGAAKGRWRPGRRTTRNSMSGSGGTSGTASTESNKISDSNSAASNFPESQNVLRRRQDISISTGQDKGDAVWPLSTQRMVSNSTDRHQLELGGNGDDRKESEGGALSSSVP